MADQQEQVQRDMKSRIEVNEKELASLKLTLTKIEDMSKKLKLEAESGDDHLAVTNALINYHNSRVSFLNQIRSKEIELREQKEGLDA